MRRWRPWSNACASLVLAGVALASLQAQSPRPPSARLVSATRLTLPTEVDSSNPAVWALVDGVSRLFVMSSWGGTPVRSSGATLDALHAEPPISFVSHPGHGVWIESVIPAEDGTWYAYYHHERPADLCGRPDRQLPRIGALRSTDLGATWEDLGIVIDAPPGAEACDSNNRFVMGGVGDVTAVLDAESQDLYLYFSQYSRDATMQGVAVARLAWADRDAPVGKVTIWNDGAWLPARQSTESDTGWTYPAGTTLESTTRPFHDRSAAADVFWGPSIHWNTYLEQHVMLLNRAKDDQFGQEGIYVSYSPTLVDPSKWTSPVKLLNGGSWYPQIIGLEMGTGTDRLAGQRARFFITGRSERVIEFAR